MSASAGIPARTIYAVSELAEILRALLEDSLPSVWVEGEISNFARPASGHWYFTLKDSGAQLRCAMFRGANFYVRPPPKDGDAWLLRARVGLYPARGELQLVVEHMEPAGTGALLRAFEALKAKLAAEGLFDAAAKRPLPELPRRIGLITSGTGAALHDVLTALARRWPLAQVCFHPALVQGAEAPAALVHALGELPRLAEVDLILLVRGGGSLEDLWAFNDEGLARAIRACPVPVVTGIGHETDVTIADFAADLRAATPTAAAELATPDIQDWGQQVQAAAERLERALRSRQEQAAAAWQRAALRLRQLHPGRRLQDRAQRLDELDERLRHCGRARLREQRQRLGAAAGRLLRLDPGLRLPAERRHLDSLLRLLQSRFGAALRERAARLGAAEALLAGLDPQLVLRRGYAIVRDAAGQVLSDAAHSRPGALIEAQLARGRIRAEVQGTDLPEQEAGAKR